MSKVDTAVLLERAQAMREEMLQDLRALVEIESPSDDKAAVNGAVTWTARRGEELKAEMQRFSQQEFGDHLQMRFAGKSRRRKPLLLLGHLDTVWPMGTLAQMPFKIEEGRAFGPGVLDMKSGVVMALYALRILAECGGLDRDVFMHLVSDEEVGSETSRPRTEAVAKTSGAVLVLEPGQGANGAAKTWRKGVGEYTVRVEGIAAHSGVDFEKGQSAILELAAQIAQISTFTDLERGLTVNVGTVRGGTRSNVIAAEAECAVDVRIQKLADAAIIEKRMRSLKAKNRKCKLHVTGGLNRPPMERSKAGLQLYAVARDVAREIGFVLQEEGTGGGSDGNFTAALGIPTLDGLGGVGQGAHAAHEHIVISELPRRTAMLAGLIQRIP